MANAAYGSNWLGQRLESTAKLAKGPVLPSMGCAPQLHDGNGGRTVTWSRLFLPPPFLVRCHLRRVLRRGSFEGSEPQDLLQVLLIHKHLPTVLPQLSEGVEQASLSLGDGLEPPRFSVHRDRLGFRLGLRR